MSTKIKIAPLFDRIVVRADTPETKTKSGLFIPETVKDKPMTGVVVEAGPGFPNNPTVVKQKDKVLYGRNVTEIEVNGESLLIMMESNIHAKL